MGRAAASRVVACACAWFLLAGAPTAYARAAAPATSVLSPPRLGGEIRIRGEALDNALDLNDGRDDAYQFTRMRYRLWTEAKPRDELKLFFRLGGEYRWGQQGAASIRDPESRVSLDNGWMEIAWPPGAHLTWRLGRQDLMYGEGFLIFDGTPADGSSSAYFDALKTRWQRGAWTVDAFTAKLQDRGFGTTARDEDLHGLYAVRSFGNSSEVEAYGLNRFKRQATVFQAGKPWEIRSPRQRTTAIGARVSRLPESGVQFAAEGAYQFGTYEDQEVAEVESNDDRRAFGGYARGGWVAPSPQRFGIEVGGLYLSGDDQDHGAYQGWDPFYSEWPKWSELLVYTMYDGTTRIPAPWNEPGAWSRLAAVWGEVGVEPVRGTRGTIRGTLLRSTESDRSCAHRGSRDRGLLIAACLDQQGPAGAALQLLGERFLPGGFYRRLLAGEDARLVQAPDPAWYARLQITAGF